jgi:hypothetical protein
MVFDGTDALVEPLSVTLTDANNLVVTFGSSTSGKVVVVGGSLASTVYGVKKYTDTFSSVIQKIVSHNLNTTSPIVMVYDSSGVQIFPDITVTDANSLTLDFGGSSTGTVEVHGGLQSTSPGSGTADFLPNTNNAFDVGSGTFKWKSLYLGNSLFLGVVASDPVSPVTGQMWFNSVDSQFKGYNGSSIIILG